MEHVAYTIYMAKWENHFELRHFLLHMLRTSQKRIELRIPGVITLNMKSSLTVKEVTLLCY